jgi:hypothetical protein
MPSPFVVNVVRQPIGAARHKKKTATEAQDLGTVQSFVPQYSIVSGNFTKKVENVASIPFIRSGEWGDRWHLTPL